HVVTAARADVDAACFALRILSFHAQDKLVHAAIIFFIFSQRKSQAVSRSKIADDIRERTAIIARAIYAQRLAVAALCKLLRIAVQADADPSSELFAHW